MDPALYERFFAVEDSYWWSRWVRDMVQDWLPPLTSDMRVLDLGCGTGILSQDLQGKATVVSADYAALALAYCRRRHLRRLVQADGHALPLRNAAFDVVLAVDTIEHLADDAAALREVRRIIKPRGMVIINVPAFQFLWSSHDVANQHFRRYSRPQLRRVVEAAGFQLSKLTYTNLLLFPPTLAVRWAKRLGFQPHTPEDEILKLSPRLNEFCYRLLDRERDFVRRHSLPFGTSVFAVARPAPGG